MDNFIHPDSLQAATFLAFEVLTILVTLATIVTSLTPSRWDNKIVDRLFQFLNLIAGNVGHNKNADD